MPATDSRIEAVAVIALMIAAPAALADQLQFNPRVEAGGETDSNYLLLPSARGTSASGGFGNVVLELHDVGAVTEFRFAPGVYATYFPNNKDVQSTDPYAYLELIRHGQTSTARLWADWSSQSTVFSERLSSDVGAGGLGNPTGGDSGYLALRNRTQTFHVNPWFAAELSPLNHATAELNYYDSKYDNFIPNTNVGYRAAIGTVGWVHDLTPRTSWTVRALYSHYQPDGAAGSTNSAGLEGEWHERVSEKSQAYVRVGARRARFDQVAAGQPDHATSFTGGAGVNWSFQVTQLFLDLTRTVDPNSTGFTVVRDQLRGRIKRNLAPLLQGYVGARVLKDTAQQSGRPFNDRAYAVGTAGLEWRLLRAWTLVAEYNYTRQKYQNDPEAAKSNAATLSFVYEPHRDLSEVLPFGGRGR